MRKEDIEFYIMLMLLIFIIIAVGMYVWHVQMAALSNCTKPCTVLNGFLKIPTL